MQLAFIGDSLTLGTNDPERLGWAGRICKRLDPQGTAIDSYNLGIRASTTEHIESRWTAEITARITDRTHSLIVFSFGAADHANGLSYERSTAAAERILRKAKENYQTLFITPPPMINEERDRKTEKLAEEFIKICHSIDIPCMNINSLLRDNAAYLDDIKNGDGVHPGDTGYEIMAGLIYDFISPHIQPHLMQSDK